MALILQLLNLAKISITSATVLLLVSTALIWFITRWYTLRSMPPGPTPLPLLGNLHQIARGGIDNVQWTFNRWAKEYGDVYTFHVGTEKCVVLNSYDSIKEAFSMQEFSGRPSNFLSEELSENMGVVFTEGAVWKAQRRFALSLMKDLGVGKLSFEDKVLHEVETLLSVVERKRGEPFDMQYILTNSVANIISAVLWGKRYEHNEPEFQAFLQKVNENVIACNKTAVLLSVLPVLRICPGDLSGTKQLLSNKVAMESFIQAIIDEHKSTFDHENLRDFVDAYLAQIEQEKHKQDTSFHENQLLKILGELLVAGLETTSTTLRWALLYLTLNPDVQERARSEILQTIGKRQPSMRDRPNLHFVEAVLMESHRLGRVVSTGVPHSPTVDVTFRGFVIPRKTTVLPNMASVFLNEDVFTDPYQFKPQRFLDEEGRFDKRLAEHVIPFSTGRRVCLGETLARMELFLFLTSLLQKFVFTFPRDAPLPSTNGIQGFTFLPRPHLVCAKILSATV